MKLEESAVMWAVFSIKSVLAKISYLHGPCLFSSHVGATFRVYSLGVSQ